MVFCTMFIHDRQYMTDQPTEHSEETPPTEPEATTNSQVHQPRVYTPASNAEQGEEMTTRFLALLLFLMLLAFFIVLNSISDFQRSRMEPVIDSVEYAFASKLDQRNEDVRPSVAPSEELSLYEGDTVLRIKALFTSQIPGFKSKVSKRKGTIFIRVPYEDFRGAVLAVGQKNALEEKDQKTLAGIFFLPTLVALLQAENSEAAYRMDIIYNLDRNPSESFAADKAYVSEATAQLGSLVTKIQQAGLKPHLMSAGVQAAEPGTIDLYFRRTEEGERIGGAL